MTDTIVWGEGTPGPWRQRKGSGADDELPGHAQIDAPKGHWYSLAQVVVEAGDDERDFGRTAEGEANARAIVQVPAMVAALREARADIADLAEGQGLNAHEWTAKIDAILAAIDGESAA